ncbi:MAG: GspH/FimT family pseudopilin [Gammaproteobacteria bacterium]|nr:GspH/FimT family pseudopilin [Gammaproteobacteria bacterium]
MSKNQWAFSIFELLVGMSITATLLLITFASLHNFIAKNNTLRQINKIVAVMQLAKMEAIRRGEPITFCKSSDQKKCGGNWCDGQIVTAKDGTIIRNLEALPPGDKLTWKSSFSKNDALVFLPSGATNGQQGSFFYCTVNAPNENLAIIIEHDGRIRISNKTATGKKIVCD